MKRYNCDNHSSISDKNIDFMTKLKIGKIASIKL